MVMKMHYNCVGQSKYPICDHFKTEILDTNKKMSSSKLLQVKKYLIAECLGFENMLSSQIL